MNVKYNILFLIYIGNTYFRQFNTLIIFEHLLDTFSVFFPNLIWSYTNKFLYFFYIYFLYFEWQELYAFTENMKNHIFRVSFC